MSDTDMVLAKTGTFLGPNLPLLVRMTRRRALECGYEILDDEKDVKSTKRAVKPATKPAKATKRPSRSIKA